MAVAGFRYRINGPNRDNVVVDVGLVRPYTFTGLLANTEYAIEAQSYDENDIESEWPAAILQSTEEEGEEPPPSSGTLMLWVDADGNAWVDGDGNAYTTLM